MIVRDQAREPRVVQFGGRRYSIRLEAVFWRVLERLAAGRQMRLGKLIGELATSAAVGGIKTEANGTTRADESDAGAVSPAKSDPANLTPKPGVKNLTSFLRVYCMLESEIQAARAALSSPARGLFEVLGASPAPAAVLSRECTVVAVNKCMMDWLDSRRLLKIGDVFTEIFQVRSSTPFTELWRSMMVGSTNRIKVRMIYVVPGRVSTVEATFVYCGRHRDRNAYVALWLNVGGPASIKPSKSKSDDGDLSAGFD